MLLAVLAAVQVCPVYRYGQGPTIGRPRAGGKVCPGHRQGRGPGLCLPGGAAASMSGSSVGPPGGRWPASARLAASMSGISVVTGLTPRGADEACHAAISYHSAGPQALEWGRINSCDRGAESLLSTGLSDPGTPRWLRRK